MEKCTVYLVGPTQRAYAKRLIDEAPADYVVRIKAPTRSDIQNDKMWAMLEDLAEQLPWHGLRLVKEEWKIVMTAALRRSKVVPNIDGTGFVDVGQSTSKMTVAEMSDLIALIDAFGSQQGIRWSDPAQKEAAA